LSPQRIAEPERQVDNAQSTTGAMPVKEQDPADGIIQQLTESGELEVLTRLQRLEITCRIGGADQLMQRRGRGEDPAEYEARIFIAARARIIAELRTGVSPADIFERLSPFRRQTRFEEATNRQWLTGANTTPLYLNVRNNREERAGSPALEQDRSIFQECQERQCTSMPGPPDPGDGGSGSPDGSAHDIDPRGHRRPRDSFVTRATRRSLTGDANNTAVATDRSSDHTDEIVHQEIQDAYRAAEGRSEAINVGKMVKILVPKYTGGESIDAFLKFLREFLVYLINYNLMGPSAELHRVSLLGVSLKERALKWYQHTEEDNDDSLSLNNWACTARICEGSDSEDDNNYVVYRGEPFLINGPDLEDWSETTDTPLAPNDTAGLFSMATHIVEEEEAAKLSKIDTAQPEQVVYRQRATKDLTPYRTEDSPKCDFKCLGVIEGYIHINRHKAHVLLDGGSTLDMISANFAAVHKLDMFQLKKPIKLQMVTSGSCSVINYGARTELHIGELKEQRYFDVVNLDRYHAILGTPFLHEFDIMLNYAGYRSFKLKDCWFPVRDGELGSPLSREGREQSSLPI
jgi:hypothetical protein